MRSFLFIFSPRREVQGGSHFDGLALPGFALQNLGGQAALSFVFLIGIIIALIGVTLAFLTMSFLNSSYGFQASQQALAVASGGAEDALLRLVRNKDFSSPLGYCVPQGMLPCGDGAAQVTVQNPSGSNQATVISQGLLNRRTKSVQVIVSVASGTGGVQVVSWQQISF